MKGEKETERGRDREMERQSERLMSAWELGVRERIIFKSSMPGRLGKLKSQGEGVILSRI